MKSLSFLIAVFVLAFWSPGIAAEVEVGGTNQFHSQTAGFTIVKPKDWVFASAEQVATNRAMARLKDKEFQEQMVKKATPPLVAIMKHPEPYADLNPSAQVVMRPLGTLQGRSAVELLRLVIPTLQRAMADFTIVEPLAETKVDGLPAATARAKYTIGNAGGQQFKTLSRIWVIPRGTSMFLISMSGPQEGPDVSEKEFAAILATIKISQ